MDGAIQRLNNLGLLNSELSGGKNCPTFEKPGPGLLGQNKVVSVSSTFVPPCATTSHKFQPPISDQSSKTAKFSQFLFVVHVSINVF